MSINDPLFSLDIIGATDITSASCILRKNKTTLVGRGPVDTIVSMRDEILSNRGYTVPEHWDTSWNYKLGPIWTPAQLKNLETWLCPENFTEYEDTVGGFTVCIEAENRAAVDGIVGGSGIAFTQNNEVGMPRLDNNSGKHRSFTGLLLDGADDYMAASPLAGGAAGATDWNVGAESFLVAVFAEPDPSSNKDQPLVSKRNEANFSLHIDYSGTDRDAIFHMGGAELKISLGAPGNAVVNKGLIIICGRGTDGKAFLESYHGDSTTANKTVAASADTSDLDTNYHPVLGDELGTNDEYEGYVYECVFVNDGLLDAQAAQVTDDNKDNIVGYLAHKYEATVLLNADHPYKIHAPKGVPITT